MKTYMVPCFVVVFADSVDDAVEKVSVLQSSQNTGHLLYQDEGIAPIEVTSDDEYHSMLDYYGELK